MPEKSCKIPLGEPDKCNNKPLTANENFSWLLAPGSPSQQNRNGTSYWDISITIQICVQIIK